VLEQVVIYRDPQFYAAFPDVELMPDGELLTVFRRAPRRARIGHLDSCSQAILVRSGDGGWTWSAGELVAEGGPDVGVQDPSICRLSDGRLISNFFKWQVLRDEPYAADGLGACAVLSEDGGRTWSKDHIPLGRPAGVGTWVSTSDAILELPDGALLAPLYENNLAPGERGGHRSFLRRSTDGGHTWHDWGTIAYDPFGNLDFEEPALAYLPSGKLLCALREDRRHECAWLTQSADGGKTWQIPWRLPLWGHPQHLLALQSGSVLCTYGYRRPPYGVRACLSRDEGQTWDLAHELVIRADGIGVDLGYPSSVQLADGRILTAYYMAEPDASAPGDSWRDGGVRYIAGSFYREW
jgi:sialidase-1